ncbi:MAG: class I SAM-dependent methyltransferase, partial [Tepidiformaceae bacterium]
MDERGWEASARAWTQFVDEGDVNRTFLLDPVMLGLCGDVASDLVLDVGCGEGRFGRILHVRGARVIGVDPTASLIGEAARRAPGPLACVRAGAEGLPFKTGAFDLVVSYVMLVDVPDIASAISEMARCLRPGGRLVVSNLSFMSAGNGWIRDAEGRRLHYPVDRYFEERAVELDWQGIRVVNWHRPLQTYMQAFLREGLI